MMKTTLLTSCLILVGAVVPAQSDYATAALHYEGGRFSTALEIVRRELRSDPTDVRLKRIGAWCLVHLGEQEAGVVRLQQALRWLEEVREAGRSDDSCELGVARACRSLAERAGDEEPGRARLLERAWEAVSAVEGLHRHAGAERVRILVLLGRLDDAEHAVEDFAEACREPRAELVERLERSRDAASRRAASTGIEGIDIDIADTTMLWLDALGSARTAATSRRAAGALADRSAAVFRVPRAARFLLDTLPDDERLAPGCVLVLGESEQAALRIDAARALGRLDGPGDVVVGALIAAFGDRSPRVVAEAVTSLGLRGELTGGSRRAIEALLEHDDDEVRRRAVAVLRARQDR